MANGFIVNEFIAASPIKVWSYLIDFANAGLWMPGIDQMTMTDDGPLSLGTTVKFTSRGKQRQSRITALEICRKLALTSTHAGVTATYEYELIPAGDGTDLTLTTECSAQGLWKLVHPVIVVAMRKADSSQLSNLKAVIEQGR